MGEHTVTSFDDELGEIERLLREMGDLARAMLADATKALIAGNRVLAQRTVSDDAIMDARQHELDERAITLIAKRQPMAQDLRAVVGAIRIASDMERIGDLAKNIAKRVGVVGGDAVPGKLAHGIEGMSDQVHDQMARATEAYAGRNAEALRQLRMDDEKIDLSYTAVFRELLTYMMEDPRNISACTHLLFCAKNLERIGDHVTNIAENAFFIITGAQLPAERPKIDETGMRGEPA